MYLPYQTAPACYNPDAPQNQTPTVKEKTLLHQYHTLGYVLSCFLWILKGQ